MAALAALPFLPRTARIASRPATCGPRKGPRAAVQRAWGPQGRPAEWLPTAGLARLSPDCGWVETTDGGRWGTGYLPDGRQVCDRKDAAVIRWRTRQEAGQAVMDHGQEHDEVRHQHGLT